MIQEVETQFIGLHSGRHIRSQLLPANVLMAGMHPDTQDIVQYFCGGKRISERTSCFQLGVSPFHLGRCRLHCMTTETAEHQEWICREKEGAGPRIAVLQNRDWLARPIGETQRGCDKLDALHFSHVAVWSQISGGAGHAHLLAQLTGAQESMTRFMSSKVHNSNGAGKVTRISQRRTAYPATSTHRVTTYSIHRTGCGHGSHPQFTDLLCLRGSAMDNELFARYFEQLDITTQCQIDNAMYHGKECAREKWHIDLHYISKRLGRLTRQIRERADRECTRCGSKGGRQSLRTVLHGPYWWRNVARYEECTTCNEVICSPACLFLHMRDCGTSWTDMAERKQDNWAGSLRHVHGTVSTNMTGHHNDRISWYRTARIPIGISRNYTEEVVD